MNQEMKLAVLIDAENISTKYIDVILSEANNLGDVIYKRIYGNWTTPQMASWRTTILNNAIQPIQQYSNTTGKNSTDSALIIDTMDLLYQSNLDGFCIVSSDSDFTRLASRLRESQKYVLGMGESKTPGLSSRHAISSCISMSCWKKQKTKPIQNQPIRPKRQSPMIRLSSPAPSRKNRSNQKRLRVKISAQSGRPW